MIIAQSTIPLTVQGQAVTRQWEGIINVGEYSIDNGVEAVSSKLLRLRGVSLFASVCTHLGLLGIWGPNISTKRNLLTLSSHSRVGP